MSARVLIVDDEPLARELLRTWVGELPDFGIVGEARHGEEAWEMIAPLAPDIILLDVCMPLSDGFALLERLDPTRLPVAILVTAYDKHALQAFEVNALDYIVKPFDRARLRAALGRAMLQVERIRAFERGRTPPRHRRRLAVKDNGRFRLLRSEQIDWIESAGDYACLHVGQATFIVSESLGALGASLDPETFLRIHRSTIVNLDRVRELHPHTNGEYFALLADGTRLKVSRGFRDGLRSLLHDAL